MTEVELKLKEYLNKHTDIIEKSLKNSTLYYETIIVHEIEIDNDYFSAKVQTMKNSTSCSISPFLPIPQNFLRKNKLLKINKK